MYKSPKGFTLIELLIVVAIVAILAVVVIFALNPGQLLAQARDSSRLQDSATILHAISIYQAQAGGNTGENLGDSSTVYVSIPDSSATSTAGTNCAALGLPTLVSSMSYHCASTNSFRAVNGTGWIPVNLSGLDIKPPLSTLPVDPVNTTSSGYYYMYVPGTSAQGGGYVMAASLESAKYQSAFGTAQSAGNSQYLKGSNLSISLGVATTSVPAPFLTNFSPTSVALGGVFTATGGNFALAPLTNRLYFRVGSGSDLFYVSALTNNSSTITFTASTVMSGNFNAHMTNANGSSNSLPITVF